MRIEDIINIVSRVIAPLKRKILLSVAHGLIEASKDDGPLQFIQATYLEGETKNDVRKMHHFGFSSHAPKGSECIAVSVAGNREASVIIATENREFRFKNLGDGEVAIYSKSGDYIHLKDGNAIDIKTKTLTINADDEITVNTKTANVNASAGANITSPLTKITGNLEVTGTSKLTGDVTADANVVAAQSVTAGVQVAAPAIAGTGGAGSVTAANIVAVQSMLVANQELNDYENHTHDYTDSGSTTNPKTTQGVN